MALSTDGYWCWHQFNTNSNPQVEVRWRRKLFSANSSIVIQHSCENSVAVRRPWGQAPCQLDHSVLPCYSAPLCSSLLCPMLVCSALLKHLWCFSSRVSAPEREIQSLVFDGKLKYTPRATEELTYIDKSPCPGPWLVYPHVNEDSKSPFQFDWYKRHCPNWSKWSCSDWSVKKQMEIWRCSSD